ncbi:hypothetical protein LCGC14_2101810 [marine sediment metagenome]|uniref:Uncharacterized protein n=1 Tax=marine sediment metagenome TaxID=412755 RepID=A0A0F9E9X9_9ZZZZ
MAKEYTRSISIIRQLLTSGRLILFDDFETLLRFNESGTGGDSIFELDPNNAYSGKQCLHLPVV